MRQPFMRTSIITILLAAAIIGVMNHLRGEGQWALMFFAGLLLITTAELLPKRNLRLATILAATAIMAVGMVKGFF